MKMTEKNSQIYPLKNGDKDLYFQIKSEFDKTIAEVEQAYNNKINEFKKNGSDFAQKQIEIIKMKLEQNVKQLEHEKKYLLLKWENLNCKIDETSRRASEELTDHISYTKSKLVSVEQGQSMLSETARKLISKTEMAQKMAVDAMEATADSRTISQEIKEDNKQFKQIMIGVFKWIIGIFVTMLISILSLSIPQWTRNKEANMHQKETIEAMNKLGQKLELVVDKFKENK